MSKPKKNIFGKSEYELFFSRFKIKILENSKIFSERLWPAYAVTQIKSSE